VDGEGILSGERGTFIVGSWDFRTNGLALYTPAVRDSTVPEIQLIHVYKQTLGEYILHSMKQMISWFHESYAPEHLEQDLARYAAGKSNDAPRELDEDKMNPSRQVVM
jgi:hypothetical protein